MTTLKSTTKSIRQIFIPFAIIYLLQIVLLIRLQNHYEANGTPQQQHRRQEEKHVEPHHVFSDTSETKIEEEEERSPIIPNSEKDVEMVAPSSPFAYSFLLGGIHEDRPAYKGFLYSVMIAANLLRKWGSTADFWIWVQLSPDSNLQETLPIEDLRLLQALNFTIRVLPQPNHESFAEVVYSKFRVLQMTQYERVMFLDADIMPLVNLDYLFHLSTGVPDSNNNTVKLFRPNFILATRREPCNTGLFIVQPQPGDWEQFQEVIRAQHERGKQLPYPHFDWYEGWGYNFRQNGDHWEAVIANGTYWKFHAGHSDQGLMYYWAKFVKQDVTIVIRNRLQHWLPGKDQDKNINKPRLDKEELNLLESIPSLVPDPPMVPHPACRGDRGNVDGNLDKSDFFCYAPYRHFRHFSGSTKPWQQTKQQIRRDRIYHVWFDELHKLNLQLNMNMNFDWKQLKESPLGQMATWQDRTQMITQTKK